MYYWLKHEHIVLAVIIVNLFILVFVLVSFLLLKGEEKACYELR